MSGTARLYGAIGALAIAMSILWPVHAAIAAGDVLAARFAAGLAAVLVCFAFARWRAPARGSAKVWWLLAGVSAGVALACTYTSIRAANSCAADYEGRSYVIGREFTPVGAAYVRDNPGAAAADLLLDAGGRADIVWTANSIGACRLRLGWAGLLSIPWLAACAGSIAAATRWRPLAAAAPAERPSSAPPAYRYDAFLSYRHGEPDSSIALDIVERLEQAGLKACVDARDFRPNQHVIAEMERGIRSSRFVLCVITARYLASDFCVEEAVLSKTLDMSDRRRRIVPLVFERTEMPVWLHGLTGIDFTGASAVDPFEKLQALLSDGVSARP